MTRRPRKNHRAAFKAKVALGALMGEQTIIDIAKRFNFHPNQVTRWKKQLLERASGAFGKEKKPKDGPGVNELNAKIGQLVMANDFLAGALGRVHGKSAKK
jgi:transposase